MTNLQIAKLYVAVNGTAPTAAELATLSASATTAADIMAMVDFTGADNTATLNAAYQAAFGRDADAEGLAYWGAELTAGNVTGATLMEKLLVGADVYVSAGDATIAALNTADKGITANKATVALEIATAGLTATEAATALALVTATDATAASASVAAVVDAAAAQAAADAAAAAAVGEIVPFTGLIDTLSGTAGDDIFVGDNNTITAADQIAGGAGIDLVKMYGTNTLPEIEDIESIYINTLGANNINVSTLTDVTSLEIDATTVAGQVITIAAGQTVTLDSITGLSIGATDTATDLLMTSADTVTSIDLVLDAAGDAATALWAGFDAEINMDAMNKVNTVNITATNNASFVALEDADTLITAINVSGDQLINIGTPEISTASTAPVVIDATANTAGVTATAGEDKVDFLGGAGDDKFTLTTVAVDAGMVIDMGAGDDSFVFSTATSAANFTATAATIDGGEGTDTLTIKDLDDVVDAATTGVLFENFEVLDLAATAASSIDMDYFSNSSISQIAISADTGGVITVTDLADTASISLGASLTGGTLSISEKGAGAGSPDDSIDLNVDAKAGITTTSIIDFNDIETVNVTSTSTGVNQTQTLGVLNAAEATVVNANASTAALTISDLDTVTLVKFDASASTGVVSIDTQDTIFAAVNGAAFIFGAGKDVMDNSGASIQDGTLYQGNGEADDITLDATGNAIQEYVKYVAQSDSTATDFDTITNFDDTLVAANDDRLDITAFGFTGTSDDAITAKTAGISISNGDVVVTESASLNFFETTGVDYAVAQYDDNVDSYVFVDINKDGDFSAAEDLVVYLEGVTNTLTVDNFLFA